MNIYDRDELPNGDDFPVTGGFPLPSDIESEYKFILVGPDGEWVCDLAAQFSPDLESQYKYGTKDDDYEDCPDVWSSEAAYSEALDCLNYSVKVVKK